MALSLLPLGGWIVGLAEAGAVDEVLILFEAHIGFLRARLRRVKRAHPAEFAAGRAFQARLQESRSAPPATLASGLALMLLIARVFSRRADTDVNIAFFGVALQAPGRSISFARRSALTQKVALHLIIADLASSDDHRHQARLRTHRARIGSELNSPKIPTQSPGCTSVE